MVVEKKAVVPLIEQVHIFEARQLVKKWALELQFTLVDQTKMITAASELARNTIRYGSGGVMRLEQLCNAGRRGLRLTFEDKGPGIPNVELAMTDGYTTGKGMGLGLGGAKRLCHDFEIFTKVGEGTRIAITRWK